MQRFLFLVAPTTVLALTLSSTGRAQQPVRPDAGTAVGTTDSSPPSDGSEQVTADPSAEAFAHLRYGIEQLHASSLHDTERVAALEARLAELEARATPSGGGPSVSSDGLRADIETLRRDVDALRADLEEQGETTEETTQSIFAQIAHALSITGYVGLTFEADEHGSAFEEGRLNLLLNAELATSLRFIGEIEFEEAAAVGEDRGGAVEVEMAYLEHAWAQAIGLRFGVLLVPFGYYNPHHETWRSVFLSNPLISNIGFPSTYADVGVELFGSPVRGGLVRIDYRVAMVNGLGSHISTLHEVVDEGESPSLRETRQGFGGENNAAKSVLGRVGLTVGSAFSMGLSGYWGAYADDAGFGGPSIQMGAVDAQLVVDWLVVRAEGLLVGIDAGSRGFDDDGDPMTPEVQSPFPTYMVGAVADAEVRFWPHALSDTFLGRFDDPRLFVAARFDGIQQAFAARTFREYRVTGAFGYRPVLRSAITFSFMKGFGDVDLHDDWRALVSVALGY